MRKFGMIGGTLWRPTIDYYATINSLTKGRLSDRYQMKTIVPPVDEPRKIQDLIYDELSVGTFEDATRKFFLEVIDSLQTRGAQAAILGCTEFPLLLKTVLIASSRSSIH
jgi:aspartate/glutamate racemase